MPPSTDLIPTAPQPTTELAVAPPRFATQAAVVAAGGIVAGAATMAIVRRRRHRPPVRGRTRDGRAGLPIVASRSFVVDIHVLGRD